MTENNDDRSAWTSGPASEGKTSEGAATAAAPGKEADWERGLINRLAFASLNEQRRARRWSVFFKSAFLIYLTILLFIFISDRGGEAGIKLGKHTALINVRGVIADTAEASADNIISSLRSAFDNKQTVAIILRINSPGGSPVQAGYVNDEIARLREMHPDIPLYAVITDICASGGYYIAAAADKIFADKASVVGSIGVLMDGFGFVEAMDKLGIERRLLTAGESKGFMDPFSPLKESDVQHVKSLLSSIHRQFIEMVKSGRGERLKDDDRLFSGLMWTGEQSVDLGLVDGLGSSSYVAREVIGQERIVDFTLRPDYLQRFADRFGVAMAKVLATFTGVGQGGLR